MEGKLVRQWISSEGFLAGLSFLTLTTFVVAQSVYEVVSANPQFLAVRRVGNPQLLLIVLVFNLLPALILFLLWFLGRRLHSVVGQALVAILYFVFGLAFFWHIHNAYLERWQPFPHPYLLWLIPAALVGIASVKFPKAVRSFVILLSPSVLLFPGLFLHRTWRETWRFLPQGGAAIERNGPGATRRDFPPIFLIVYDEFTPYALLDQDGQIDGTRFPNFKKLAAESYWFRNATANAEYSERSLPTILAGSYPKSIDPSAETYPDNLFVLLRPYYEIHTYEMVTNFCNPRFDNCHLPVRGSGERQLLKDASVLYATRVLPQELRGSLPDLTRTWGPFLSQSEEVRARVERFQGLVNSLQPRHDNVFYYFDHQLPHSPYLLTREGQTSDAKINHFDPSFAGNRALLLDVQKQYLMQVEYVDKELGQFIAKLKELGIYEKALLIVTADHGVSWKLEAPGRTLRQENAEMILTVPLFIKKPYQERPVTTDADVQLIDLLPTVADVLGLQVPWQTVGRSVFKSAAGARRKVAYDAYGNRFDFDDNLGLNWAKARLDLPQSPFLGQKIRSFEVARYETLGGSLDHVEISDSGMRGSQEDFLINVLGWAAFLDARTLPDDVLVALNDEVVAVASPRMDRPDVMAYFRDVRLLSSGWLASFSSERLRDGENRLVTYVVIDPGTRRLAFLSSRTCIIYKTQSKVEVRFTALTKAEMDAIPESSIARSQSAPERKEAATPHSSWIGESIDLFDVIKAWPSPFQGGIERLSVSHLHVPLAKEQTVEVAGWAAITGLNVPPGWVAVAVNNTIVAITSPCCDRPDIAESLKSPKLLRTGWGATFSSRKLKEGENLVTAYIVLDAANRKLAALPATENKIQVTPK